MQLLNKAISFHWGNPKQVYSVISFSFNSSLTLCGPGRYATYISVGMFFACVILNDGGVACWGNNAYGEMGIGTTTDVGFEPGQMGNNLQEALLGPGDGFSDYG